MKKNRMLRIASVMLVLAIITTCVISGTFAKYVTSGSGSDSARVAKWGIKIAVTGDEMFKNTYAKDDGETEIENTVVGQASALVVAPGTKSANGKGLRIKVTGQSETAVRLTFDMADTFTDIVLPAGTYADQTAFVESGSSLVSAGTFDVATAYYPVEYKLTGTVSIGGTLTIAPSTPMTLTEIRTFLNGRTRDIAPNTDINIDLTLTWEWKFNDDADHWQKDTYLGAAANDDNLKKNSEGQSNGVSTDISYSLTVKAEQID